GIYGPATAAILFSGDAHPVQTTPTPDPNEIPGLMANGYPILVNDANYIPDNYQAVHLVNLKNYCDSSVVKIKGSDIQAEKYAVDALLVMLRAARAEGYKNWQVNAGYRSIAYQQKLFDERVYAYRQEGMSGQQARAKVRRCAVKSRIRLSFGSSQSRRGSLLPREMRKASTTVFPVMKIASSRTPSLSRLRFAVTVGAK
ncbi:MAG: D-alanyl-D-alanine carboxypeptidase family protein, partial [Clostridia bacterium]|nr:D-alanyl-D-alanine carboxypeptidase family protein [Clostridia bacterium]